MDKLNEKQKTGTQLRAPKFNSADNYGKKFHSYQQRSKSKPENYEQPFSQQRNKTRQKKPILNDDDLLYPFDNLGDITKKSQLVNLNHLLNFSFPERQKILGPLKRSQVNTFSKERFVNSNFRFVMEPGFDASDHLSDPDFLIVPNFETVTCPICLDEPIAPRYISNKTSTVVLPMISHKKSGSQIPMVDIPSALVFAKLLQADEQYLLELNTKELNQLETYQEKVVFESGSLDYESSFIETCINEIKHKKTKPTPEKTKHKKQNQGGESYFFYQASNGQHLYLHPLDIKVLKSEFGEYESLPMILNLPVISIVESTVNTDLRKRFKYLSHLPLLCDINFCEVDLSKVVSLETFNAFSKEIAIRTEKLVQQELRKKKESKKAKKTIREEFRVAEYQENSFVYDENDFGPILSSSPELLSSQSTPTNVGKSFAKMAIESNTSLPSSWQKKTMVEVNGWKLDIPEDLLEVAGLSPAKSKGKKKKSKILLVGNSGSRAY